MTKERNIDDLLNFEKEGGVTKLLDEYKGLTKQPKRLY